MAHTFRISDMNAIKVVCCVGVGRGEIVNLQQFSGKNVSGIVEDEDATFSLYYSPSAIQFSTLEPIHTAYT